MPISEDTFFDMEQKPQTILEIHSSNQIIKLCESRIPFFKIYMFQYGPIGSKHGPMSMGLKIYNHVPTDPKSKIGIKVFRRGILVFFRSRMFYSSQEFFYSNF
jgi:hypothetical protein